MTHRPRLPPTHSQLFLSNALYQGGAAVAAEDGLLGALGQVQGVLDAEINSTGAA